MFVINEKWKGWNEKWSKNIFTCLDEKVKCKGMKIEAENYGGVHTNFSPSKPEWKQGWKEWKEAIFQKYP